MILLKLWEPKKKNKANNSSISLKYQFLKELRSKLKKMILLKEQRLM